MGEKVGEHDLIKAFKCPKCNGRSCICHYVSTQGILSKIALSAKNRPKFVFLTCQLCGYTEVYDAHVKVKAEQTEKTPNRAPDPAKPM